MNSWRITTQILVLQLVTILTVLTMLSAVLIFMFVYINQQATSDSNTIMVNQLLAKYSNSILIDHSRLLKQKFNQITHSLEVVNKLSDFIVNNDYQNTQNVDACLLDELDESNILYFNQYCYGIFDPSFQQSFDFELKLSNILTQTMPMQQKAENIYFLTDNPQQYFSCYPGIYLDGYVCLLFINNLKIPNQRPWYLNQKNASQNYTYSEPYPDYQGGILITETMNLFGQNQEQIGVIGQDITSSQFEQFNYKSNLQFYLIDSEGEILLFPGMNTKIILHYFDQEITGFNSTDFESLLMYAKTKEIDNTEYKKICSPIETLCLLNKLTNEYHYIYVDIHPITQYIFIVEVPSSYYQVFFKQLDDVLNAQIFTHVYSTMYFFIGIVVFCLIICFTTTKIIHKPIEIILNRTNSLLKSNEDTSNQELKEHDESTAMGQLGFAFERLIMLFNQSEMQQKPEQNFQFPTRNVSLQFYLKPKHLHFLQDNQKVPSEVKLKLIRDVSQQWSVKNKTNFLKK